MRTPLAFAALAVAAILAACGDDPTGPRRITGAYRLSTIAGQPLPLLVREEVVPYPATGEMATRRLFMDAMRIVLPADAVDTVVYFQHVTWQFTGGGTAGPNDEVHLATNVVRGDTLCLRTGSFDDAGPGCAPAQVLYRKGSGIAVQFWPGPSGTTGRAEYVFVRE